MSKGQGFVSYHRVRLRHKCKHIVNSEQLQREMKIDGHSIYDRSQEGQEKRRSSTHNIFETEYRPKINEKKR